MFQLTENEVSLMVSQNAIPSKQHLGGSLPFVFTEQGVSMLASVLRSDAAVEMSIKIIRTFILMRKFISQNALLFQRVDMIEKKQQQTDKKLEKVLDAIEEKNIQPTQGIFFDGQIFDAYVFTSSLIKKAKKSIVLIDNYIDETVLLQLSGSTTENASITILTKMISKKLELDLKRHNAQYKNIVIKEFTLSHDRFLIIDETVIYHIGASLKDLGKKWFAFSKMSMESFEIMGRPR